MMRLRPRIHYSERQQLWLAIASARLSERHAREVAHLYRAAGRRAALALLQVLRLSRGH